MTPAHPLQKVLRMVQGFEESHSMADWPGGWTPEQVGLDPGEVEYLYQAGLVTTVRREQGRMVDVAEGEHTGYRLTDNGIRGSIPREFIQDALRGQPPTAFTPAATVPAPDLTAVSEPRPQIALPDDLFSCIVGFDDIKELLSASLQTEKPVHVLLIGPPALAKSLFLWEIERAYGERALWLLGSSTSQAGMWDLVATQLPQVLLLDEFEKIKTVDQAALLSLMEGGRLMRAKVRREINLTLECRVYAVANTTRNLTPEILSRFARRELRAYNEAEFREVVTKVLVQREGMDPAAAAEVAAHLAGRTQDVRDAIRVARLSQQVGVEKALWLLGL